MFMDPITVSAASGMQSRMESLEMLANNLANASTAGYKKDSESYSLYISQAAAESGADADPVTATLPVIQRNWTDFSPGSLQTTGNPLDMALNGEGFFSVQGPNGPLYTRAGQFRVAGNGTVTSNEGYPVLLNGGTALTIDAAHAFEIAPDGAVTQSGQALGQLAVVRFASTDSLSKAAGTYYTAAEAPQAVSGTTVVQGSLEGSNVSSPQSAVRLIDIMRQFEMLTKAVQINMEMNSKATSEVAKVVS
jgi:flagellar basal-body rod protein FlgF